jgi:hypothetical protein
LHHGRQACDNFAKEGPLVPIKRPVAGQPATGEADTAAAVDERDASDDAGSNTRAQSKRGIAGGGGAGRGADGGAGTVEAADERGPLTGKDLLLSAVTAAPGSEEQATPDFIVDMWSKQEPAHRDVVLGEMVKVGCCRAALMTIAPASGPHLFHSFDDCNLV